ncbi:uncharacterized protein LOC135943119 [Cloeon dipterum]|uniref:uncharacterized protein LOC135943119 n=1 Tax=Cloeon dipterum TaxID=197152 RepID=UPI0032202F4F
MDVRKRYELKRKIQRRQAMKVQKNLLEEKQLEFRRSLNVRLRSVNRTDTNPAGPSQIAPPSNSDKRQQNDSIIPSLEKNQNDGGSCWKPDLPVKEENDFETSSDSDDREMGEWNINDLSTKEPLTKLKKKQVRTVHEPSTDEDSEEESSSSPAMKKRKSFSSAARPFKPDISTLRETAPGRSLPVSQGNDEKLVGLLQQNNKDIKEIHAKLKEMQAELKEMQAEMNGFEDSIDRVSEALANLKKRDEIDSHQWAHFMKPNKDIVIISKPDCLPTSTIEEVYALEALLKDKERNKEEIAKIREFLEYEVEKCWCWKTGARKTMAEVFEIQVQTQINWEGPSKKSNGRSLPREFPNILDAVTVASKLHPRCKLENLPKGMTLTAWIHNEIKNWLRHAGDRATKASNKASSGEALC